MLLNQEHRYKRLQSRLVYHYQFLILLFCGLVGRLYYLQIFRWKDFRDRSRDNLLVTRKLPGARGMIFDRRGRLLVSNRASFNICFRPQYFLPATGKRKAALRRAAELVGGVIGQDPGEIVKKVESVRGRRRFRPLVVKRDLSWEELSRIAERWVEGLEIQPEPIRSYPNGALAAHVLGYVGEITERQLAGFSKRRPDLNYRSGDMVGQYGLEKRWEYKLRGKMGYEQKIFDARGAELSEDWLKVLGFPLDSEDPTPGHDLTLTLDLELQAAAEEALGKEAGAVVALDPRTGEVLALASSPSFDPAAFARGVTRKELAALNGDPKRPLFNRAIQGAYPPGSTFKIVTAAAALEEKVADKTTTHTCKGYYQYGNHTYNCWRRKGHGKLDLKHAIMYSCDVFFYNLGEALGIERLARGARLFGLGRLTGIDLDGEKGGLIPDPAWKMKNRGEKWYGGETIVASIGQGAVHLTPLQVAVMTAAVANGGYVVKPRLLEKITDHRGRVVERFEPPPPGDPFLSPETVDLLRKALVGVVNGGGTGGRAFIKNFKVAGKTGTAQVANLEAVKRAKKKYGEVPWKLRDHAWFTCYAPADKPTIALSVLLDHGGTAVHGAVARKILLKYARLMGLDG